MYNTPEVHTMTSCAYAGAY